MSELLRDIFSDFGEINNIAISEFKVVAENSDVFNLNRVNGRNARFAHVIFGRKAAVAAALQAEDATYSGISQKVGEKWGLAQRLMKKTSREIAGL